MASSSSCCRLNAQFRSLVGDQAARLGAFTMAKQDNDRQLEALRTECEQLRAENARLREELSRLGVAVSMPPDQNMAATERRFSPPVKATSSAQAKIALFRSLFRGREDVHAMRWQRADGRSGYSPRAKRDWKAYLSSEAADRRTVDRETRALLPLNDGAIGQHLRGEITVGVYPLLRDETCWFLAVDFDKKAWQEDARAFAAICGEKGVPAAIERSRSGNGAHVWIFFEHPVPAATARRLGCALLTATMERRYQLGLDSYDRLFPSQDTMPKGGFGNFIALPLQKAPRQDGNSVFVDDRFAPYPDQWAFLAGVKRMSILAAESIVQQAMRSGGVIGVRLSHSDDDEPDPWTLPPSGRRPDQAIPGPLPSSVSVVRANLLFLEKAGLPSPLVNRVLRVAAFQNPEFYKAQAMRLSTFDKPRVISCGEELDRHIALPAGQSGRAHRTSAGVLDQHPGAGPAV